MILLSSLKTLKPGSLSSPGFNPLNLNPSIYLDAREGVLNSLGEEASNGEDVATWTNQGSGSDATQTTPGDRPSLVVGSDSAVRFPGSSEWMEGTLTALNGARSFVVGTVVGSPANADRVLSLGSGGNDTNGESYIPTLYLNSGLNTFHSSSNLTQAAGFTGRFIHEVLFHPGEQVSWRNGTDEQSASPDLDALSLSEYGLCSKYHGGGNFAQFDLEFVGVFPADLSAGKVAQLREFLTTKYGPFV